MASAVMALARVSDSVSGMIGLLMTRIRPTGHAIALLVGPGGDATMA